MDGNLVEFNVPTFRSPIRAMKCIVCDAIWAVDFERTTCHCMDKFFITEDGYYFNLGDCIGYYDGNVTYALWVYNVIPYYAYLMEVCPKWFDFS